jgi:hypothetical protein
MYLTYQSLDHFPFVTNVQIHILRGLELTPISGSSAFQFGIQSEQISEESINLRVAIRLLFPIASNVLDQPEKSTAQIHPCHKLSTPVQRLNANLGRECFESINQYPAIRDRNRFREKCVGRTPRESRSWILRAPPFRGTHLSMRLPLMNDTTLYSRLPPLTRSIFFLRH